MLKLIVVCLLVVSSSLGVKITYPEVRRDASVVDEYLSGSVKVSDPYRWLEDPDSEETRKFVEAQNKVTDEYLRNGASDKSEMSQSLREDILKALIEAQSYPKVTLPVRKGSRYIYLSNSGLQNPSVIYTQDSLEGKPRVLVDPNTLSEDGSTAIALYEVSADGELLAYGLRSKGSDWVSIKVRNISSGNDYPEVLSNVKFSTVKWLKHKGYEGFFYAKYPEADKKAKADVETGLGAFHNQKIYYHRVGTNQTEDILATEFPDHPNYFVGTFKISRDDKYLFILPVEGGSGMSSLYYARLDGVLKAKTGIRGKLTLVPVVENFKFSYVYIANDDSIVYLKTDNNASNYRIVAVDLNKPQEIYWTTIVPEDPLRVLLSATAIKEDKLILKYLEDVKSKLEMRFLRNGSFIQEIPVEIGDIDEISGDRDDDEFFFNLVSFLTPGSAYRVDLKKQPYEAKLYREVKANGFDASKFVTKQVFYKSKDGTRVPMFIVHKKDYVPQSNSPTYLYAYGGFGIVNAPDFTASRSVFLQNFDGVYALANIRGGGEYGAKWHKAAQGLHKQNGLDDFQAAAEYLYNEKYTTPSKLFINGGSNGGFLVAACVNQRPDLFGAAVAQVGYRWTGFCIEFGCSDSGNAPVFENLKKLSPYHNIRVPQDPKVQYPAVLLTTGDHDERVVPLHSYKLAAELQYVVGRSERQTNPLLLKISTKAGHGQGKQTSAQLEEFADIYTFLVRALGFKFTA